jgi:hypothetical protein
MVWSRVPDNKQLRPHLCILQSSLQWALRRIILSSRLHHLSCICCLAFCISYVLHTDLGFECNACHTGNWYGHNEQDAIYCMRIFIPRHRTHQNRGLYFQDCADCACGHDDRLHAAHQLHVTKHMWPCVGCILYKATFHASARKHQRTQLSVMWTLGRLCLKPSSSQQVYICYTLK